MQRPGPYYRGLATSILQDAAEALLRILAVERRLNLHDRDGFEKILNHVANQIESVGDHRASLSRLNGARIMFKHQRLTSVQENDIIVFYGNVESFLTDVCRDVLNIDFGTVSLANAIGHRRTQNWIEKAEHALAAGEIVDAVQHAAGALRIYIEHSNEHDPAFGHLEHLPPLFHHLEFSPVTTFMETGRDPGIDTEWLSAITEFAGWAKTRIENIYDRVQLMARGVDVASFDRFTAISPRVVMMGDGSLRFVYRGPSPSLTHEDARFSIDVVTDVALALRSNRPPKSGNFNAPKSKVRVIRQAELVVSPYEDPLEIIRIVEPDEELDSPVAEPFSLEGDHVSVFQDGDAAYVRKECLEEVAPGP